MPPDPTSRPDDGLRAIPPVHEIVAAVQRVEPDAPRAVVTALARQVLDGHRAAVRDGAPVSSCDTLAVRVTEALSRIERRALGPVINATGILIHTGLGRAPLPGAAVDALRAASGYTPVELDLAAGTRGRRVDHVRDWLVRLSGAESATAVNNTAGALLLVLAALARDREVIVSRGELVEIGGSFRLPEIMAAGGARLREVGTTNRTRVADYANAINDDTALILKVHTSNYRIEGFAEEAGLDQLVDLGRRHDIPVVHDAGSGAFEPMRSFGLDPSEPLVDASIRTGADLVMFSGDKLLAGPQSGLIVGRADLVARLEAHPMMRALRLDKLRLAALAATLPLHTDREQLRKVPVFARLAEPRSALVGRGRALAGRLAGTPGIGSIDVRPSQAYLGGGSLPTCAIDSVALVIRSRSAAEKTIGERLRRGDDGLPPVVPRIADGALWFDLRTVHPDEDDLLARAITNAL